MLEHCQLGRFAGAAEHWYDGWRFGERGENRIYCPWSIAGFRAAAPGGGSGTPRSCCVDSSANDIIDLLPGELPEAGMRQLRTLLGDGEVTIGFREAMACDELPDGSGDALFSMLYLTGYLTRSAPDPDPQRGLLSVRIPNEEVRECLRIMLSVIWAGVAAACPILPVTAACPWWRRWPGAMPQPPDPACRSC